MAKRYLWGPAENQLLAQEDYDAGMDATQQVLWAAADHQESVRDYLVYDAGLDATTVYAHFNLDSFGNIVSGDFTGVRYIYTAQEYDAESGIYFYDARYYIASIGRFIDDVC